MKRRELVAGMALAGMNLEAEPQDTGSIYIPQPHRVEDRKLLHDFMDEFAFVDLVTATPSIRITHIPVILDRAAGRYGTLRGHIARKNPQIAAFDGRQPAVIVFHGPHSYISPTWYAKHEAVPTWNFAVVHASGKLTAVADRQAMRELLGKLVNKFEDYGKSGYDLAKLPAGLVDGMIGNIVGFAMEIERLEGKFKLGQDRSEGDQEGILRHLGAAKPERSLHDLTAGFYGRLKG